MELGNNYAGCDLNKDYASFFLFPIGMEILLLDGDLEIALTIWPLELTFGIRKNRNLFRN